MNIGTDSHLSYCTNIHAGESWDEVFNSLKDYCLPIKKMLAPCLPFGIGLRLSNQASIELLHGNQLSLFKSWLDENNLYVFTINGFPYGNFHSQPVKDKVHTPDWTTVQRLDYTKRLFVILAELLLPQLEGGISTSPLSYRHWYTTEDDLTAAKQSAAANLIHIVGQLVEVYKTSGKKLHLDIEPEPDGILESSSDYISFFEEHLLTYGATALANQLSCPVSVAQQHIRTHIQLCYDVCHFAVGYEKAEDVIAKMETHGLLIGKIQISAALKCSVSSDASIPEQQECLLAFDEPVYLHQAVVKTTAGQLHKFRDLGDGIKAMGSPGFSELRTHFHVPVFASGYRQLSSTQSDIKDALRLWCRKPYTRHLEVETYTWDILPADLQTSLTKSIERELRWVKRFIEDEISNEISDNCLFTKG